jgi:hypothetical protein
MDGLPPDASRLLERLSDDWDELEANGIVMQTCEPGDAPETVLVTAFAEDEAALRQLMRERYGDAVEVEYAGPPVVVDTVPLAAWRLLSPDRVEIRWTTNADRALARVECEQSDTEVRITVYERIYWYEKLALRRHHATVVLSRPLGSRQVIDAATGCAAGDHSSPEQWDDPPD